MPRPEPTQEELDEEQTRSTPIGFFNYAETYRTAAKVLDRSNTKATHKDSPVRFLYYHAIELYLKTYLLAHGIHPYQLRVRYRHNASKLSKECERLGLFLADESKEVVGMMSKTDMVIRSRYISTGFVRWPEVEALDRTCESLRVSVAKALREKGELSR